MKARRLHSIWSWTGAWPHGHAPVVLLALAAFVAVGGALIRPAGAAPAGGLQWSLGFGGFVKIGAPLPLDVVLPAPAAGGPATLTVDAPALGPEAGRIWTSTVVPFTAVAGAEQAIHVTVTVTDPRHPLVLRVAVRGREVERGEIPISPERVAPRLIAAVSQDRAGLASLRRLPDPVDAGYVDPAALPRRWQEYEAVDLLVIRDLDPSALEPSQESALRTWVALGGRLLVIAPAARGLPAGVEALLPAAPAGPPRMVRLANGAGGEWLPASPLAPRGGARTMSAAGVTVAAWTSVGRGRMTVSALDPWQDRFLEWAGRADWWRNMLGAPPEAAVDTASVAAKLPVATPVDPRVHGEVGLAILLYIVLVLALLRWHPGPAGWAGAGLVVPLATLGFALLAGSLRSAATTLTQISVVEPLPGEDAKVTTVAAVAVPYGGRYQLSVPPDTTVEPLSPSGSLAIAITPARTRLSGALDAGEPARVFQAERVVPLSSVQGWLSADGTRLYTAFGPWAVRRAEVRLRDRVYEIGSLPRRPTVTELYPDRWAAAASESAASSDLFQAVIAAFRRLQAGAILTTPVLIGEIAGTEPVFTFTDTGSPPGQRVTVVLMPLEQR